METLVSQFDRQLPALLVRPLRAEFGLSDTAFSLLQGHAFAVAFTLAGLPLGQFVDRGNRRNIIGAGLLFWSAATGLFAFGQSYEALLLARIGVGIGEAVLAPAAYSLIADLVPPRQRGRALAAYAVSLAIGTGASLLLGGWLLAAVAVAGAIGILAGGHLSDRWLARGVPAARSRVALLGLGIATVPAVTWPRAPHAGLAFGLLFFTVLGIGLAQSAVPTSIQAVFPNRLRGKAFALYLLLAGLLGIGLGPTAVALVTDRLLHDEQALGLAIALTAAPAALLGLWMIATGLKHYTTLHAALHMTAP